MATEKNGVLEKLVLRPTETRGISRSRPGDAGGGAAHAEDEKGLSCVRNEGKARLAAALSE